MIGPLQLFPDDGTVRPPGVADHHRPDDGTVHPCPKCGAQSLYWRVLTFAHCEQPVCDYIWRRSSQLHHTERLPL